MPDGEEALQARVAQLSSELAAVEQDILEAEAKHELYKLLETRTRWEAGGQGSSSGGTLASSAAFPMHQRDSSGGVAASPSGMLACRCALPSSACCQLAVWGPVRSGWPAAGLGWCRRDHAASEQRMRESRALKEGAADDYTTLVKQMHEMRAAKEDAERELGGVVGMYDQVRGDWSKKLRDRRKEVRAGRPCWGSGGFSVWLEGAGRQLYWL